MAVAGWYPDPDRPGRIRWWDGLRWTANTRSPAQVAPGLGTEASAFGQPQLAVPYLAPQYHQANPVVAVPGWKPPARLALTSVILGGIAILFGWFVPAVGLLCGLAGVVFGIVSMVKASGAPAGTVSSRPLAITGAAVSGAALLFAVVAAIVWVAINSA